MTRFRHYADGLREYPLARRGLVMSSLIDRPHARHHAGRGAGDPHRHRRASMPGRSRSRWRTGTAGLLRAPCRGRPVSDRAGERGDFRRPRVSSRTSAGGSARRAFWPSPSKSMRGWRSFEGHGRRAGRSAIVGKAPDATVMSDLDSRADWAAANKAGRQPHRRTTGFCRGGRTTWLYAAHNPNLKAAVASYGPVITPDQRHSAETRDRHRRPNSLPGAGPVWRPRHVRKGLGCGGRRGQGTPAGKEVEIVVYPDAPHGFHADYRPSYRPADAADGWARMLQWFALHGVSVGIDM